MNGNALSSIVFLDKLPRRNEAPSFPPPPRKDSDDDERKEPLSSEERKEPLSFDSWLSFEWRLLLLLLRRSVVDPNPLDALRSAFALAAADNFMLGLKVLPLPSVRCLPS